MGEHGWLVTLLAVAPDRDGEALAARIDRALAADRDVLAAAGCLPGGCGALVRILAGGSPARSPCVPPRVGGDARRLLGLPLPPLRK